MGGDTLNPLRRLLRLDRLIERRVDLDCVEELGEIARLMKTARPVRWIYDAIPILIGPSCRSDPNMAHISFFRLGFVIRRHERMTGESLRFLPGECQRIRAGHSTFLHVSVHQLVESSQCNSGCSKTVWVIFSRFCGVTGPSFVELAFQSSPKSRFQAFWIFQPLGKVSRLSNSLSCIGYLHSLLRVVNTSQFRRQYEIPENAFASVVSVCSCYP